MLNTILPEKKCDLSNSNYENSCLLKKENNSLDDCMSIEMCNEFYKIKSLNKNIDKNESLPRNIKDILKEMYVDELFISTCQHMVDLYSKYFGLLIIETNICIIWFLSYFLTKLTSNNLTNFYGAWRPSSSHSMT